jgi:hypothetical protein
MNLPEIYWSAKEGEDSDLDLIPGRVTRVEKVGHELRLFFAGRHGEYGDQYQGVLRIRLRPGRQTVEGTQSYKPMDEPWEPVRFSVVGEFKDQRFTTFAGDWTEGDRTFQVEIFGLPSHSNDAARRKRGRMVR